jgi:hypothetical protein
MLEAPADRAAHYRRGRGVHRMIEHPGVRHLPDAELTDYDRELIERIDSGWLPKFDPSTARAGEAARAYGRQLLAEALGGPEALAVVLGEGPEASGAGNPPHPPTEPARDE